MIGIGFRTYHYSFIAKPHSADNRASAEPNDGDKAENKMEEQKPVALAFSCQCSEECYENSVPDGLFLSSVFLQLSLTP